MASQEKPRLSRNFSVRAITGIVLLPLILYVLFAGGVVFAVFIAVMIAVGTLEYTMMVTGNRLRVDALACISMAIVMTVALPSGQSAVAILAAISGLLVALVYALALSKTLKNAAIMWILSLFMGLVGATSIILRWQDTGIVWWVLITASTWSMDTLSYAGGRTYGKRPLFKRISPKKTLEGAITGYVGSFLISLVILYRLQIVIPVMVLLVLGAPLVALIGDMLESVVKRYFHVKDSHVPWFNLIPGHGGLLDRIDALMTVTLYFFVFLAVLSL